MVHSDDMHREVGDISTRRYRKNTKKRKKLETQNSKHFRALTLSGAPSTLMHTRPFTRVKEFVCVCEKKINGSGSTVLSCMICSFKKPCRHIFGKKICRAHTRKKRTTRKVDFTNAVSTVKKKKKMFHSAWHITFVLWHLLFVSDAHAIAPRIATRHHFHGGAGTQACRT